MSHLSFRTGKRRTIGFPPCFSFSQNLKGIIEYYLSLLLQAVFMLDKTQSRNFPTIKNKCRKRKPLQQEVENEGCVLDFHEDVWVLVWKSGTKRNWEVTFGAGLTELKVLICALSFWAVSKEYLKMEKNLTLEPCSLTMPPKGESGGINQLNHRPEPASE